MITWLINKLNGSTPQLAPEDLLGKYLLVGFTYYNREGYVDRLVQQHGIITEINRNAIYFRNNGEQFSIPLELRSIKHARPGIYKIHSTGEEVINPDFLSTWSIYPSEKE